MGHAAGIRELLVLPVNPTYLATTGVRSEVFRVERRNTQSLSCPEALFHMLRPALHHMPRPKASPSKRTGFS